MIKTPLSTMVGGAGIWTPGCTVIGGQKNMDQLIKSLFSDGTQGIYLNAQDAVSVSDLSSIKDLSGNNNHALQANSASRASLITDPSGYKSLKFDGIDDGYVTPSINFSNTDKVTVIAVVRKLSDTSNAVLVESNTSFSVANGAFCAFMPRSIGASGNVGFSSKGTVSVEVSTNPILAPRSLVLTATSSISNSKITVSVDGIRVGENVATQGSGNYGNYPLYIGRRAGAYLPFNGQIYAILVIGKLLDATTTAKIEKEFAKYIGVTL